MKLSSRSKLILAIVAVVFVVFNVVFLLVASSTAFNANTFISWAFMILGFVSFLLFSFLSASKDGVDRYMFLRFTLIGHCTIYLIVDFVLAVLFTVLGALIDLSLLWTVSIQVIALGIHVCIALACLMAKTSVAEVDTQVKQRTSRMKGFRAETEMLVEYCKDANAKNDFRKFAEAVRYSDPMSCDALDDVENSLAEIISEMKSDLIAGDVEAAQDKCKIANNILKERNKKCLLLK